MKVNLTSTFLFIIFQLVTREAATHVTTKSVMTCLITAVVTILALVYV